MFLNLSGESAHVASRFQIRVLFCSNTLFKYICKIDFHPENIDSFLEKNGIS